MARFILFLIALGCRLLYVFCGTDYRQYVYSDCMGYWSRAYALLHGDIFGYNQWALWPPLYHLLLAAVFGILHFVHLSYAHWLPVVLVLQILLASASVVWLTDLVASLTGSQKIGMITGWLYTFCYPLIYLNAFVLSENAAIPLLIGGLALGMGRPERRHLVGAGALLALAIGMRPAFGLVAVLSGVYFYCQARPQSVFLLLGMFPILALLCGYDAWISGGRVTGLAANGGLNFAITQGQYQRVDADVVVSGAHYHYTIAVPAFVGQTGQPTLSTDVPFDNEAYYYARGLGESHFPWAIGQDMEQVPRLWFGPMFPAAPAPGMAAFDRWLLPILGSVSAVSLLGLPLLAWLRALPLRAGVWLLWGIAASPVPVGLLYGCDRRFGYGVEFASLAITVCLIQSVKEAQRRPK